MNNNKAMLGYLEGFLEDAKPFMDLLKALGYFTEEMELTEKGKKVLYDYWDKQFRAKGIHGVSVVEVDNDTPTNS